MAFTGNRPRIGELLWDPNKALDLFSLIRVIRMYSLTGVIPAELIAVIFFEETAFCNVRQTTGRDKNQNVVYGLGVGFGQTQIYDPEKRLFFASIAYHMVTNNQRSAMTETPQPRHSEILR